MACTYRLCILHLFDYSYRFINWNQKYFQKCCSFLPRNAIHSTDYTMPSQDVCLSVCYTPVFCRNGSTHHQTFFTVGLAQHFYININIMAIFRRRPPNGGVECRGYEKSRFSTNLSISQKFAHLLFSANLGYTNGIIIIIINVTRYGHSYYRRQIGNDTKLSNGTSFNDLKLS